MLSVNPETPLAPNVLAVLAHIHEASVALNFQYFMIGAQALDMQLHNVYGLPTLRPTNDTDFGVAVESWAQFTALKEHLVGTGHFELDRSRAQRLQYDGGFPVDLVPFGGIERADGTVAWPPDSMDVMTVLGFSEINAAADTVVIPGSSLLVRAASLPGLSILKLFSWNDRMEPKDARDVAALLQNYSDVIGDVRLFSNAELLRTFRYETIRTGAALLGKDASEIVTPTTLTAIQNIISGPKSSRLTAQIAAGLRLAEQSEKLSLAENLLAAFQTGLGA